MKSLIDSEKNINIVIASIELRDFDLIMKKGKSKLPKNVNLISVYDALGAAYLQDNLRRRFKDSRVTMSSADTFNRFDETIITVGGSSVNLITYALMEDRKLDKCFKIVYPDHYAVDNYGGENRKYFAKMRGIDENIVEDYGFILVAPSPFNPRKYVCVLAGLWPYGTYGAIYSILNPKETGLYKGWKTLKRKNNGYLAVLHVFVAEDYPGIPRLVQIREIDPPLPFI